MMSATSTTKGGFLLLSFVPVSVSCFFSRPLSWLDCVESRRQRLFVSLVASRLPVSFRLALLRYLLVLSSCLVFSPRLLTQAEYPRVPTWLAESSSPPT
ncbi:hypothetical protein VTK73DRAFT_5983 [Phialemonium thermophilum]|uniref:Secreted protein n=1 Tax=Phialemonium thermophilum TaxID=223376 RepID=A0ABR3V068_9PEZI